MPFAHAAVQPAQERLRPARRRSLALPLAAGALALLALTALAGEAEASHFRHGSLNWEATGAGNTIAVSGTQAWRASAFGNPAVGATVGVGTLTWGDGTSSGFSIRVTATDPAADWFYGNIVNSAGNKVTHTYPSANNNGQPWKVFWGSCCWIGLSNGVSSMSMEALVDLSGGHSASPKTTLPPITDCPNTGICSFTLPATDLDGDALSFRLATGAEVANGGGFNHPTGMTIGAGSGTVTWDSRNRAHGSLWAVGFAITDAKSKTTATALVRVYTPTAPPPSFVEPPSPCGDTITVNPGGSVSFDVRAQGGQPARSVTLGSLGLPPGAAFSAPAPAHTVTGSFAWATTQASVGSHVVVFTARDDLGQSAPSCNVNIVVRAGPSAGFTYAPASPTTLDTVQFTDTSTSSDGTVQAWEWDFTNDGSVDSTAQHAAHRYATAGAFNACLRVQDSNGLGSRTCRGISVAQGDNTPPATSASVSPQPGTQNQVNGAGWNRGDVTVVLSATDAVGVASITWWVGSSPPSTFAGGSGSILLSAEGSHVVSFYATDTAGNAAATKTQAVNIDRTAPAVGEYFRNPQPNQHGWNSREVAVYFRCTDALSGVPQDNPGSTLVTAEGEHTLPSVCTDHAGNTATAQAVVRIDLTPPVATGATSRAPNAAGWFNAPLDVTFACSDALSGVAEVPASIRVFIDGANQAFTRHCSDKAGNAAPASVAVNLDTQPPSIAGARTPEANSHGWSNVPVTVTFACADTLSGVASVTPDQVVAAEGAGQSRSGTCLDLAGNEASAGVGSIHVDLTAPDVTGSRSPAANAHGWNRGPVTVGFACTDALSGVAMHPEGAVLAEEGRGQGRTGTCTDKAGNAASASVDGIHIDLTPPTLALASRTPANAHGWNNGPVTVAWDCGDALSGPLAARDERVVAQDGDDQAATGRCEDLAGNEATLVEGGIRIDTLPPQASLAATCALPGNAPWCRSPSFGYLGAGSDALSGVDSLDCTADGAAAACEGEVAGEGAHALTARVRDLAGNEADAALAMGIDSVAPDVAMATDCALPGRAPWCRSPSYGYEATGSDATSGLASVACDRDGAAASCAGTVAGEGLHALRIEAVDVAGNAASASVALHIDSVAPVPSIEAVCALPGNQGWCRSRVDVDTPTSDATSGVAAESCVLDGAAAACDGLVVEGQGSHAFALRVEDVAGNAAEASEAFKIDSIAPDGRLWRPDAGSVFVLDQRVHVEADPLGHHVGLPFTLVVGKLTVVAQAQDATSGVDALYLHIDGVPRALDASGVLGFYHMTWDADEETLGEHALQVRVEDVAGNALEVDLEVVTVPTTLVGVEATLEAMGAAEAALEPCAAMDKPALQEACALAALDARHDPAAMVEVPAGAGLEQVLRALREVRELRGLGGPGPAP